MKRISSEVRTRNKEIYKTASIQMKKTQSTLTDIKNKIRSYHIIEIEVVDKIRELKELVDSYL